jgi:hypothetical protein
LWQCGGLSGCFLGTAPAAISSQKPVPSFHVWVREQVEWHDSPLKPNIHAVGILLAKRQTTLHLHVNMPVIRRHIISFDRRVTRTHYVLAYDVIRML